MLRIVPCFHEFVESFFLQLFRNFDGSQDILHSDGQNLAKINSKIEFYFTLAIIYIGLLDSKLPNPNSLPDLKSAVIF